MGKPVRARNSLQKPVKRRASATHRPIKLATYKRQITRRKRKKQRKLPHILCHFTFVAIGASLMLFILWFVFRSQALFFDAIVLLVFCGIVDGLALALQR